MVLTKEKLQAAWKIKEQIFSNKSNEIIVTRFDDLKKIFDDIKYITITYENNHVKYNTEELIRENGSYPNIDYFGCGIDDLTREGAYNGVKEQINNFPSYKDIISKLGCVLGGFDFKSKKMIEEYRIISNKPIDCFENNNLCVEGIQRHPSSNLADNTYFFNVISTINEVRGNAFNCDQSKLVLRWKDGSYYKKYIKDNGEKDYAAIAEAQRETLKGRFPYKFFHMWTHQQEELHLVGLKAYIELVRQPGEFNYEGDQGLGQDYASFVGNSGWRIYSDRIKNMIDISEQGDNFWYEMSKLLSILMLQDQQMKNLKDLLDSHKAIILYGAPGTGKTYSAKDLICQELDISKEEMDSYKIEYNPTEKGSWVLVQFHPNYTYEDFIGGISPGLNGQNLSYCIKEGIFKKVCDEAVRKENETKKYIVVIDEINRADLSSVFGELMYALEYRGKSVIIPNFKDPFIIPDNVYLIGTMNSIDKSLVTFDLALRRRFGFYKMDPQLSAIEYMLSDYYFVENCLEAYIKRCEELNNKIADPQGILRLGKDYQIGHAYYGKIKNFLPEVGSEDNPIQITSFDLEKLWIYHLEPLLEEYLGSRIDDSSIEKFLEKLKEEFIKPLLP